MLTVDFTRIPTEPGTRVLDAGCGGGRHVCEAFRRQGATVAGVDLKWDDLCKTRAFLSALAEENNGAWAIAEANIANLPFADGFFDVVICSEVLEHIEDDKTAVSELLRVLKTGGDLVVSVPRFFPEKICWAISDAYHQEPGGHVRVYRKDVLLRILENAGARLRRIDYKHGLHSPYWWLKCAVGHKNDNFPLVKAYRKFLEWDIIRKPRLTRTLDRMLNPLIGKSVVFYLKKG
ncbi:MAG: class I SAM-dependent methyltransferase [Syntrophales bacterium]